MPRRLCLLLLVLLASLVGAWASVSAQSATPASDAVASVAQVSLCGDETAFWTHIGPAGKYDIASTTPIVGLAMRVQVVSASEPTPPTTVVQEYRELRITDTLTRLYLALPDLMNSDTGAYQRAVVVYIPDDDFGWEFTCDQGVFGQGHPELHLAEGGPLPLQTWITLAEWRYAPSAGSSSDLGPAQHVAPPVSPGWQYLQVRLGEQLAM